MFSDKSYPPVSVRSCWQSLKTSEETGTQTIDLVGVDQNEQTIYTNTAEAQTEIPETILSSNVDENALASFLNRIGPKVIKELDKSSKSKAFLSYQLPDEDSSQEVKNLHNLMKPKNKMEEDVKVNSLTWNCTGSVVVLGLGSTSHDDWCSHAGFIHFYNIDRNTYASMVPSKVLEVASCVTSVATHPYEPSVLASGLHRGSVILWNLQLEGAECVATVNAHSDPVSQVAWVSGPSTRPQLISAGFDGQILVWNASHAYDTISLKESYILSNAEPTLEAGITCFSLSLNRHGIFVAALEGGKIFHCCLNTTKSITKVGYNTPLKDPVVGELEGHKGLVTCLAFSPYHEDLFLSVGTDKEIHINSIFEVAPLKVIWCEIEILGVAWSPSQANVFISWGQSSEITVYDSINGCKLALLKTNDILTLCASAFNWKSPKLLAVGDGNGRGYVWQVPQYFKTVR